MIDYIVKSKEKQQFWKIISSTSKPMCSSHYVLEGMINLGDKYVS